MQYKKDELRAVILDEAEKEFLSKGYNSASLRQIAKGAGTTIGNIYNYFESKEMLFHELVKGEYDAFIYLINNHSNMEIPPDEIRIGDINWMRGVLNIYLQKLLPVFSKRFLIMVDMSRGTRYENTKDEFIDFMMQHFSEHMEGSGQNVSTEFPRLIAAQILYGIMYIIRNYDDETIKQQLISDLLLFSTIGVMGIIGQ